MADGSNLEATAYHEAGHAVMRYIRRLAIAEVTIEPSGDVLGFCRGLGVPSSFFDSESGVDARHRRLTDSLVEVCLAGATAEARFCGTSVEAVADGAYSDYDQAVELALRLCGSGRQVDSFLKWKQVRVEDALNLDLHWARATDLAAALLERNVLTGKEVRVIIRGAVGKFIADRDAVLGKHKTLAVLG